MQKVLTVALTATLCWGGFARAQEPCGTDQKYWELVKKHPEILEYEKQFEAQMAAGISGKGVASKTTLSASDTTIFDVPLVVHVVHDFGAENLSDNDIYDAVKYWAVVFMKENADTTTVIAPFARYIGHPRIRFHLATVDPAGRPTKGVVRHFSYLTSNADDDAKYYSWPNNKYINVWFVKQFSGASGAAAYAYYPSAAAGIPQYDGVIGLYTYANYAKVIPHELGHVLNLQHVWGNNNSPGSACGNDQVDDTPPTKGHTPVGCVPSALYDTACATGYLKHYTAVSGADSIANYPDTVNAQNIMDYTYCQVMFTKGQAVRMRNALTSATAGRNNLYTASNLSATGALAAMPDLPPVADYIVNRASGGPFVTDSRTYFLTFNNANSFSFANQSWNDTISGVRWTFSNGADSATATSGTLMNRFRTPGWVALSLTATSNAGSNTLVDSQAVYVADTTAIPGYFYDQYFRSAADISNWPMVNGYRNQYKWQFYTGASYDGDNTCVRYRSFDTTQKYFGGPYGDHDEFYTPAFNLDGITGNYYLNFMTAAAKASGGGIGDSLQIEVSTNGGAKWTKIGGWAPGTLVNNGTKATEFKPTLPTQWKIQSVAVPTAYRTTNTFFRFRYWPGSVGNNLYLDNFRLCPFPAEVNDANRAATAIKIYPNPTDGEFTLAFTTGASGMASISIKDLMGRVVYTTNQQYTPNTLQQIALGHSAIGIAGMYLVSVTMDGITKTEKLTVY
jgi:hypothetical protein